MSALPEKGWAGYGSPGHPLTPRHRPWQHLTRAMHANNPQTQANVIRWWQNEEKAEHRLRHEGVLPELLMYVEGIGRGAR